MSSSYPEDPMFKFRYATDDGSTLRYVRRGKVWRPEIDFQDRVRKIVRECFVLLLAFCLIVLIGGAIGLYQARPQFDQESRTYADAAMTAIVPSWNEAELVSRLSPDVTSSMSDQYLDLFKALKPAGPGALTQGCRGQSAVSPLAGENMVTARYLCPVILNKSDAFIVLSLRRNVYRWTITDFYITPPPVVPATVDGNGAQAG